MMGMGVVSSWSALGLVGLYRKETALREARHSFEFVFTDSCNRRIDGRVRALGLGGDRLKAKFYRSGPRCGWIWLKTKCQGWKLAN